jgi:hypothetical protein
MPPDEALTPEDVAAKLGCSVWWVKKQCRERRFPCMKVGGAYRFTPAHLGEIMQSLELRPSEMGHNSATGNAD